MLSSANTKVGDGLVSTFNSEVYTELFGKEETKEHIRRLRTVTGYKRTSGLG